MRDVLLISLAYTWHVPHQHLEGRFAEFFRTKCPLHWKSLRFSAIFESKITLLARWRYHWRVHRAIANIISPYSYNYCDFQRFLLFQNKVINAGRSRKNAGMREISQNAGFPARFRDGWHLWVTTVPYHTTPYITRVAAEDNRARRKLKTRNKKRKTPECIGFDVPARQQNVQIEDLYSYTTQEEASQLATLHGWDATP